MDGQFFGPSLHQLTFVLLSLKAQGEHVVAFCGILCHMYGFRFFHMTEQGSIQMFVWFKIYVLFFKCDHTVNKNNKICCTPCIYIYFMSIYIHTYIYITLYIFLLA